MLLELFDSGLSFNHLGYEHIEELVFKTQQEIAVLDYRSCIYYHFIRLEKMARYKMMQLIKHELLQYDFALEKYHIHSIELSRIQDEKQYILMLIPKDIMREFHKHVRKNNMKVLSYESYFIKVLKNTINNKDSFTLITDESDNVRIVSYHLGKIIHYQSINSFALNDLDFNLIDKSALSQDSLVVGKNLSRVNKIRKWLKDVNV